MTPAPIDPLLGYGDWPQFARSTPPLRTGDTRADALADVLGVRRPAAPRVRTLDRREHDGVDITRLAYSVGYGPTTTAYLLRPAGATDVLPGILGMHAHGARRWLGAEQLVDPGPGVASDLDAEYGRSLRRQWYDGRAFANDLARAGFAVLVPDAFSWGSRRFDLSTPPRKLTRLTNALAALRREEGAAPLDEPGRFDEASALHEDLIAKTAGLLGTTFAGAIATDDLAALDVLSATEGVDTGRIGTFGFSGGGARAHLLGALDARIRAVAVTCMMATFDSLIPTRIEAHSWSLLSPGLPQVADWPELAGIAADAARPARSILVQYAQRDPLFTPEGMAAAHRSLEQFGPRYTGAFFSGGHEFTADMQQDAAGWLRANLAG